MSAADVLNRKLAPIYDCIETKNFKGAIKHCQKKDIQHLDITRSLHAYCLISMQRTDEGLEIARELKVGLHFGKGLTAQR